MALTKTPICDFGKKAEDFQLKSINNELITLDKVKGTNGTLIMFICNHCPYVKAVIDEIVQNCKSLESDGIRSIAISSNDVKNYPEDSFDNMIKFSKYHNFGFPYLFDVNQNVAKNYGAVCTPDFFGFNKNLELQYRGRLDSAGKNINQNEVKRELFNAMKQISISDKGPKEQFSSIGCSIKWKNNE